MLVDRIEVLSGSDYLCSEKGCNHKAIVVIKIKGGSLFLCRECKAKLVAALTKI